NVRFRLSVYGQRLSNWYTQTGLASSLSPRCQRFRATAERYRACWTRDIAWDAVTNPPLGSLYKKSECLNASCGLYRKRDSCGESNEVWGHSVRKNCSGGELFHGTNASKVP